MDIHECMRLAKRDGSYNKATFTLVGEQGQRIECRMLDAHFDMFEVIGQDGFARPSDLPSGFTVEGYDPKVEIK